MKINTPVSMAAFTLTLSLAACGSQRDDAQDAPAAGPGRIIEVKMVTDDRGNAFEPAQVTARQGDVLRFTLDTGVHSVSFPPEENPGRGDLPGSSELFHDPGQSHDVPVTFAPGTYTFRCDPHAALGMAGTLIVQ